MHGSSSNRIYTAEQRPELWKALKDTNHPLNRAWPRFLDNDLSQVHFLDSILQYIGLRKFQFAIVELDHAGCEIIIAHAQSIPFFWPELKQLGNRGVGALSASPDILQTLPDGGWDTILSRGIRQYCARNAISSSLPVFTRDQEQDLETCITAVKPNALSALSITIREDHRSLGLAERLIGTMKQAAQEDNLQVLLAPLRPTRKFEFPFITIEDYIEWSQVISLQSGNLAPPSWIKTRLPHDPWLRKHVRLGGRIVKVAPSSMVVRGSFAEWEDWTGIDFVKFSKDYEKRKALEEEAGKREYIEVAITGGLVPLKVYVQEQACVYVEPNIWCYHKV